MSLMRGSSVEYTASATSSGAIVSESFWSPYTHPRPISLLCWKSDRFFSIEGWMRLLRDGGEKEEKTRMRVR